MSIDHVRYGGTPYLSNLNIGWARHLSTSWEERQDASHSSYVQRSSLEDAMTELAKTRTQMAKECLEKTMIEVRRSQANLTMFQAENEILMGDMDYFSRWFA